MRSFDNEGAVGVMRATVDDSGVWRFVGDNTRSTMEIAVEDETMRARCERLVMALGFTGWTMSFTPPVLTAARRLGSGGGARRGSAAHWR
jgi:hypothetical protein